MTNYDRVRALVDQYVALNGNANEMSRTEFLEWVHETYETISTTTNNLYPTDMSYNLYNKGLKDFPGPNLCLIYVDERNTFRLVGTGYKFTGKIWQYKNKANEQIVGEWVDGICRMNLIQEEIEMDETIIIRRKDIATGIRRLLKDVPVVIEEDNAKVLVLFQEILICGIEIEDEAYKIFNASDEWKEKTTYQCNQEESGKWFYYIDSADEVIEEIKRLVIFEARKGHSTTTKIYATQMEAMGARLEEVKTVNIGFSYEATTRRKREPQYYKLYFGDEWIGELWDDAKGPDFWTNSVSSADKVQAIELPRRITTKEPDVLYHKEFKNPGFNYTMLLSSPDRINGVVQNMIDAYKE